MAKRDDKRGEKRGDSSGEGALKSLVQRHLRLGWWSLLAFLSLGIVLEAMHGFKIGWYLDVYNENRRLQWTLAHAHGTLLALVHIAFAISLSHWPVSPTRELRIGSSALSAGGVLMPAGFFLGGLIIYDGDPGLGVLLVPVGALCLLVGVFAAARAFQRSTG